MSALSVEKIREITTFKQLLAYLRDELDWPIEEIREEDLTFDWRPDEIGLDPKTTAKVRDIKQLRPLVSNQTWGIFFVNFEPKKLPIVVLRRILGALVVKKRQTAAAASRRAWQMHDLLFIARHGEGDERELTFALFQEDPDSEDLPVLRVLGWDGSDTPLKLDHVAATLHDQLRWPDNTDDARSWREQWSGAFRHRPGHVIRTADELAEVLASLARGIRDAALTVLAHETDRGPLRRLHKAFQTALIHDLTETGFAGTYAQTITYGLLTAAITHTDMAGGRSGTVLASEHVADIVPVTNPFLKEMLQTFLKAGGRRGAIDFDELGVQEVVELLRGNQTDLPAILRDFGNRTRGEDPVIHFYEHFLAAYDKKEKVQRGVFYTPQPVVSYIVRSIHELLRTEFGLDDGLASTVTWGEMAKGHEGLKLANGVKQNDPFVQILDPATGTATFLVEVIDVIHRTLMAKWKAERFSDPQQRVAWNEYVPKHLLPRLHGYELMMAPYAIAHMKIGLKLHETGYRFGSEERARIYLTNALEPAHDFSDRLAFDAPALAHEAQAVNAIKRHQRFTIVIGNPPYANYSANLSPQARRIVDKYRHFHGVAIRERNQLQFERNIQDDFVKFLAIAEDLVHSAQFGLLSYITNGTMLASTSLRGLREHLTQEFNELFELNLHGGVNEIIAGAEDDENVFDIVQSVAIHVYVRPTRAKKKAVHYADLLGRRDKKYAALRSQTVGTTKWREITPDPENCSFVPQDDAGGGALRRLDSVFVKFGAGIKTNRDAVAVGLNDTVLLDAVREFDRKVLADKHARHHIQPLLYRPFDVRRIFYQEDVVASRSLPTMKHVISGPNIGIVASSTWTTPERFSVNVSRIMVEMKAGTHDRGTTFFPLYRYERLLGGKPQPVHNLSQDFVSEWSASTQTRFLPTGLGDLETTSGREDVLYWLYALFYSPEYRRRYRAALAQRFPIVLLSADKQLLRSLGRLGLQLVGLHLLESRKLDRPHSEFVGNRGVEVEKISWSKQTVWIDKDKTTGFKDVPEAVWNFYMGGYQVCDKWLKDRKGRTLTKDDIVHYRKINLALAETIRLMKEIDVIIGTHGGWPGAFKKKQVGEISGLIEA